MMTSNSHESARRALSAADGPLKRIDAICVAIRAGMSLREIEEYLDWLDMIEGKTKVGP